jgi:hypothetical protein
MERSRMSGESLMVRRAEVGATRRMVQGALKEKDVVGEVNGHQPLWTLYTVSGDVTLEISR